MKTAKTIKGALKEGLKKYGTPDLKKPVIEAKIEGLQRKVNYEALKIMFKEIELTEETEKVTEYLSYKRNLEGYTELMTNFLMHFTLGVTMEGIGIVYTPDRFQTFEKRLIKSEIHSQVKAIFEKILFNEFLEPDNETASTES